MESLKGWKLVVNNCVDKSKPPCSNSWYNYLREVSPYAADHNLLPHIQTIYGEGTLGSSDSSLRQTCPRPPVRGRKQLRHQIERVRRISQDQRVESFLGSEQRCWLSASFTQRRGEDLLVTVNRRLTDKRMKPCCGLIGYS